MRKHFFLHPGIWDVVENGMQCVDSDNGNFNAIHVQEMIHKNIQATIMLLASLLGMNITRLVAWTTEASPILWDSNVIQLLVPRG
jgi:hypothetical protein